LTTGLITYGITNLVATIILKKTINIAKKEGIKFEMKDIIPPEIPDEKNGAIVFKEVFTIMDEKHKEYDKLFYETCNILFSYFKDKSIKSPEEKINQTRKLLLGKEFEKFFILFDKAVLIPECRFKINYEDGPGALLPHLAKLRGIARIYQLKSHFIIEKGDLNSALKTFETNFALGDCLLNEPFIISQFVRFSLYKMAMDSFQKIFYIKGEKLSEEYLKKLIFLIENKKFDIPNVYSKDRILIGGWCYGKILPGPFKKGHFLQGIHDAPINEIFNKTYKILFFPVLKLDATFFLNNILKAKKLFSLPFYTSADKLKKT